MIFFLFQSNAVLSNQVRSFNFIIENKLLLNEQGEHVIHIKLVNKSGKDIEVYYEDLPWVKRYNYIESIISDGSSFQLWAPHVFYSADYVLLADEASLEGELSFVEGIPPDVKLASDFVILWRYELILKNGDSLGERFGSIEKI